VLIQRGASYGLRVPIGCGGTFRLLASVASGCVVILIGHPGDKIGSVTLPATQGPLLQVIDNPNNPV
jgi:hypothetical protein